MFSKEFENTLNIAASTARSKLHEFITVEHLLLALLDDPAAREILIACNADLEALRLDLFEYVDTQIPIIAEPEINPEVDQTLGFQRVIQRAVFHVQSSGKREVTGGNVLVAIFGEKESQAVYFLRKQGVSRGDVVNYITHGTPRAPGLGDGDEGGLDSPAATEDGEKAPSPLESFATNLNEEAKAGRIDPLIGRDKEITRLVQVLSRRRKNNPLFVGEAGCRQNGSCRRSGETYCRG